MRGEQHPEPARAVFDIELPKSDCFLKRPPGRAEQPWPCVKQVGAKFGAGDKACHWAGRFPAPKSRPDTFRNVAPFPPFASGSANERQNKKSSSEPANRFCWPPRLRVPADNLPRRCDPHPPVKEREKADISGEQQHQQSAEHQCQRSQQTQRRIHGSLSPQPVPYACFIGNRVIHFTAISGDLWQSRQILCGSRKRNPVFR